MLSAAESTWLLRKSGSWRLTAISASAWILPSIRSSSIDDELGVLLRAAVVVEPQLAHRDAVLQRADDALVAAGLRRREALPQLRESRGDLLLVHRLQEAIERGLREQQAQEQPQQPIEPRRPDLLGARRSVAGRAAHAGGDAAHLEAARVQPLEARARVGAAGRRASSTSDGAAAPAASGRRRPPAARAWTLASIAARNRGIDTSPAR